MVIFMLLSRLPILIGFKMKDAYKRGTNIPMRERLLNPKIENPLPPPLAIIQGSVQI